MRLRASCGGRPDSRLARLNRILDLLESKEAILGKNMKVGGKESRVYRLKPDSEEVGDEKL